MSSNAIEKALWQAISNPRQAELLRENPGAYLDGFRLDEDERALVTSWNVSGMAARDVSPLLLMMAYTAINGMDKMPEYVQRIHQ